MIVKLSHFALGLSLIGAPALAVAQTTAGQATSGGNSMTRTPPATSMRATPPAASAMSAPSTTSGGVTHYASQSEASSACAGDTVVWASPRSKALHTSDSRYFGKS